MTGSAESAEAEALLPGWQFGPTPRENRVARQPFWQCETACPPPRWLLLSRPGRWHPNNRITIWAGRRPSKARHPTTFALPASKSPMPTFIGMTGGS